jgi:pimeloyl-ACP methyl ester carboxylesterase
MKEKLIDGLNNIKLIYGDKDKLARFNPDNELLNNLDITSDVIILDETGHFPFFERPELTASTLNKLLLDC